MTFEIYADKSGKHRWRLLADNGQNVASSGEAFSTRSNATRAARNVKARAGSGLTFEVYGDVKKKFRWRAKSKNGQTVASSGEAFASEANAKAAATNVKKKAGKATGP